MTRQETGVSWLSEKIIAALDRSINQARNEVLLGNDKLDKMIIIRKIIERRNSVFRDLGYVVKWDGSEILE